MSDSTAIALSMASFFVSLVCFYYLSKLANDVGTQIVSGAVSRKYGRLTLNQTWTGYVLGAVAAAVFSGVVNLQIADYAGDAGARRIAHMAAFFGFVGALSWLLSGMLAFTYYLSVLRQAEAD
jgi:hypothetical protein